MTQKSIKYEELRDNLTKMLEVDPSMRNCRAVISDSNDTTINMHLKESFNHLIGNHKTKREQFIKYLKDMGFDAKEHVYNQVIVKLKDKQHDYFNHDDAIRFGYELALVHSCNASISFKPTGE